MRRSHLCCSERGASIIEYVMLIGIMGSVMFSIPTMVAGPAAEILLRGFVARPDLPMSGAEFGGEVNNGGGTQTSHQSGGGLDPEDE